MRAEAVVRTAEAERHVLVGRAGDVEAVRVGKHALVAIGRGKPQDDLVARLDLLAVQLDVLGRRTAEVVDGGGVPDDLFGGRAGERGVGAESRNLVAVLKQRSNAVRHRVSRRLVAGGDQQQEEEFEFVLGERVAIEFGVDQDRDDVLARVVALEVSQTERVIKHLQRGRARERQVRVLREVALVLDEVADEVRLGIAQ